MNKFSIYKAECNQGDIVEDSDGNQYIILNKKERRVASLKTGKIKNLSLKRQLFIPKSVIITGENIVEYDESNERYYGIINYDSAIYNGSYCIVCLNRGEVLFVQERCVRPCFDRLVLDQ